MRRQSKLNWALMQRVKGEVCRTEGRERRALSPSESRMHQILLSLADQNEPRAWMTANSEVMDSPSPAKEITLRPVWPYSCAWNRPASRRDAHCEPGFGNGGPARRALHRRLLRIEDRFSPPVETEYMQELRRRIEAGRRRVAEWMGEAYVPMPSPTDVIGLTLPEAIFRGRDRARKAMDHSPT